MKLTYIRLRNWKAFPSLELNLEQSDPHRNVVIIEGSNGFGKTSLLEAIILCLYGSEGISLVGRAAGGGRLDVGYDAFLERALHQGVRGSDSNASVELTFEDDGDERFAIQRIWYFTSTGRHRRADEEVRIWAGPNEDLVPLPQGDEQIAEVRDLVARTLLPVRLAPFFLFDGEHLDRLANVDLDEQVRLALEYALGVPLLRRVSDDLKSYARDRRRQIRGGAGSQLDGLTRVVTDLKQQQSELTSQLDEVAQALAPLRAERDETVARIGSLHGDSYASFKRLFEEREHCGRIRDALQDRLRQTLSFDLALALAGTELRQSARGQIARDAKVEQREAVRAVSEGRYQQIAAKLGQQDELDQVGLNTAQWKVFEERLRAIWSEVWAIDDKGDEERLHTHLGEADRHLVDERLRTIESLGADAIAMLAHEAEQADARVGAIDRQIADQRGTDEVSQLLADRLRDTQAEISTLEEKSRSLVRALEVARAELASKERELARVRSHLDADAPLLSRIERADAVSRVIATLIERLFPLNLEALSGEITRAYRAMAHKRAVAEIRINLDGTVAMLDGDGRDLRQQDPSAGESQVFAFALMAAITSVAAPFPIILDTPLARLDHDHRARVLRYFASLDRQIVFLSQPAELSGSYLELLRPQLGAFVRLTHEGGRSTHHRELDPLGAPA
ncbi:AAA family ATPase [Bosea sp. NPDC055332]